MFFRIITIKVFHAFKSVFFYSPTRISLLFPQQNVFANCSGHTLDLVNSSVYVSKMTHVNNLLLNTGFHHPLALFFSMALKLVSPCYILRYAHSLRDYYGSFEYPKNSIGLRYYRTRMFILWWTVSHRK